MMALTRLDGALFYLNPLLVETIEATPDTVILLTSGHRYVVREGVTEAVRAWQDALAGVHPRIAAVAPLAGKGENPSHG
jgi:flagellar protein FlbD